MTKTVEYKRRLRHIQKKKRQKCKKTVPLSSIPTSGGENLLGSSENSLFDDTYTDINTDSLTLCEKEVQKPRPEIGTSTDADAVQLVVQEKI